MITRYYQLLPVLDLNDTGITYFLLGPDENKHLEMLQKELILFESVTKELQSDKLDLVAVRCLFDGLIESHPALSHYIEADADIMQSKDFKNAIAKVLTSEKKLNAKETFSNWVQTMCLWIACGITGDRGKCQFNFAKNLLMVRKSKSVVKSEYSDLRQIPPTSNRAERVFSTAKLTQRRSRASQTLANF